ncbi:MAG: biotin transporter BioY [Acetivibrionales bacterium]
MKIKTRDLILTALFAALMVAGAFIKIPFPFVPLTFQPFFCAYAGIILGSRLGALSQVLYLLIGLTGVPVFAYGGGITYIYNPTFGFIIGFIAAAYLMGKISENRKHIDFLNSCKTVLSGLLLINLIGVPYFYLIKNLFLAQYVSVWYVVTVVFLPYFVKDMFLFVFVAFSTTKIIPVLRKAGLSNV